ncbi:MAG: nuclear transport factor 2 family protein [Actinomycetota bacterium]|nr:nuclear transport factor 2 family protein [Actinomycetota bacterium]
MSGSDLQQVTEHYHRTVSAFVQGDPEPQKRLWSRRDDVTLANPLGPPVRGWNQIVEVLERAASQLRGGEHDGFERISEYATADLAYMLEIEHARLKFGGADEMTPVSLRVTTIFRREEGEWRILHRHADPITAPRPLESVLQQ